MPITELKLFIAAVSVAAVLVIVVGVVYINSTTNSGALTDWNTYKGQIANYDVSIDESTRGNRTQLIVRLRLIGASSHAGITGHDYDSDGRWDRILYCGYPQQSNGCNSMLIDEDGTMTFEPCAADEGKIKPFTDDDIRVARLQLAAAMAAVYNEEHIVRTLAAYRQAK